MRHIAQFLLLLLIATQLVAQKVDLTFHTLSEESGLTFSNRYHMYTDDFGLMWIGTENGLLKYDGNSIKKYQHQKDNNTSLSQNFITSACMPDQHGNLWFSTSNYLNCFIPSTEEFFSYQIPNRTGKYHGIKMTAQKIWVQIGSGNTGSLYEFDLDSKQFEQKEQVAGEITTLLTDSKGEIQYIISSSLPSKTGMTVKNLKHNTTKDIEFLYTSDGNKRNFPSPTTHVFIDADSTIWVGVYDGIGKYILDETKAVVESKRTSLIPPDIGWVYDIEQYDDHRLLVGADIGLLIFDITEGKFTEMFPHNPEIPNSLSIKNINDIYLDNHNNLWLSSFQQKIAFAHLDKCKFSNLRETLGKNIVAIAQDPQGKIWCSSEENGLFIYNQDRSLAFTSDVFINDSQNGMTKLPGFDYLIADGKEWWANLDNTFLRWNEEQKKFEFRQTYFLGVSSITNKNINLIYTLKSGKNLVAIGSEIKELHLSKEKVELQNWYNISYINFSRISSIYQDKSNNIFVGDETGRLIVFKIENDNLTKIADISCSGSIHCIEESNQGDNIWIGTSSGLGVMHADSLIYREVSSENINLSDESIHGISIDDNKQLWMTTNNGLIKFDPSSRNSHRFGLADGLLSKVYQNNSSITSSVGHTILLKSKNGVTFFEPDKVKLINTKPKIHLSNFLVNDEIYPLKNNNSDKKELTFTHEENTLSFELATLDYSDPHSNNYTFEMEGYDKAPVDNGKRNFVRYGNLPTGHYNFKVWSSNSDKIKNEEPFEMAITIKPPFYQRWWFYLLCLLILSSIVYGIFKYRLEQALKVERLRVKISSDLHDDVGGILSGLALRTEILELTGDHNIKTDLNKIAEMSRNAMSRMRDTVWAIDSRKDKTKNLLDRMAEHAEEVLTPKDIQFFITHSDIDLEKTIPTDVRQNIYLIFKEAITNTAKHSNGNEVSITLKKEGRTFTMSIKDNGKVQQKNYKSTGLGIGNMHMRSKQIGVTLKVDISDGYNIHMTGRDIL